MYCLWCNHLPAPIWNSVDFKCRFRENQIRIYIGKIKTKRVFIGMGKLKSEEQLEMICCFRPTTGHHSHSKRVDKIRKFWKAVSDKVWTNVGPQVICHNEQMLPCSNPAKYYSRFYNMSLQLSQLLISIIIINVFSLNFFSSTC